MILTQNNKNKSVSGRLLQIQNQGKLILVSILLELPPLDPEKLPVGQRSRGGDGSKGSNLSYYSVLYGIILKTGSELNNLRMRTSVLSLRVSLTSRHSLSHLQERQPRIDLGFDRRLIKSSGNSISLSFMTKRVICYIFFCKFLA